MVTQVFNLLRKIPVQLKLDFCVSLVSLLPQSPSFLLHRDKGERYDSTNFDVDTYIQSNSLPLWLKRHGGWGERECVCCKTISYQDNISNSIYDSQESTPTRTRNIPYPALTPEPKLKNKNENENATKILCPMFIGLLCLFIRYLKMMIDLMLFCLLFTRLSFAAFTPGGSCGQDIERREEREEWAVGSFYWSEVWLLLVVHTQLSWLVHHSSALGDTLCSWPSPGHRPHSHNIHSAVSNPGQIPVQGIYNNMQIRLAHCICIHYSLTCITSTNRFSFMKI